VRRLACLLAMVVTLSVGDRALGQSVTHVAGMSGEFRGMAAAGSVVWASGRGGTYARSTDDGVTWTAGVVPGAEGMVLVGVAALDDRSACVLATSFDGGLGRVYRTTDGGRTWSLSYEIERPGVFFDGMAFWDEQRGLAFGDPVDGAFFIMRTTDGGASWSEVRRDQIPPPLGGEAGFAASGTAIAVAGTRHAWIGTGGGPVARVLRTTDGGSSWSAESTPLPGGVATGIFGVAFRDTLHGIAVGGNYQQPAGEGSNVVRTTDGGRTWVPAGTSAPAGVRYGLAYLPGSEGTAVAVGPTGYGLTRDDGRTWVAIDTLYAFTIVLAPWRGWLAGPEGRIIRLDPALLRPARRGAR
jgi:photosystem II stability/assembly factor-like uncharacterized protein